MKYAIFFPLLSLSSLSHLRSHIQFFMPLLVDLPIQTLEKLSSTLWSNASKSDHFYGYSFEIIGCKKGFNDYCVRCFTSLSSNSNFFLLVHIICERCYTMAIIRIGIWWTTAKVRRSSRRNKRDSTEYECKFFFLFFCPFPTFLHFQIFIHCDSPASKFFAENSIMSLVQITIPADLAEDIKSIPFEKPLKIACNFVYNSADHSLSLTAQSFILISKMNITFTWNKNGQITLSLHIFFFSCVS
jgi:hypothetical protein